MGAPQHEHRGGDAPPGQSIRTIMLAVDAGCRPILLADGVRVLQIAQHVDICGTDLSRKHLPGRSPAAQRRVHNKIGYPAKTRSGKGAGWARKDHGQ